MPWLRAARASSSMVMPVIAVLLRMGPYVILRRTYDDGTRRASHTGLQPGRNGSWEGHRAGSSWFDGAGHRGGGGRGRLYLGKERRRRVGGGGGRDHHTPHRYAGGPRAGRDPAGGPGPLRAAARPARPA